METESHTGAMYPLHGWILPHAGSCVGMPLFSTKRFPVIPPFGLTELAAPNSTEFGTNETASYLNIQLEARDGLGSISVDECTVLVGRQSHDHCKHTLRLHRLCYPHAALRVVYTVRGLLTVTSQAQLSHSYTTAHDLHGPVHHATPTTPRPFRSPLCTSPCTSGPLLLLAEKTCARVCGTSLPTPTQHSRSSQPH